MSDRTLNHRGIMMVEVLLAMLIITVGLTVVIQSLSQAMGTTAASLEYTMASLAADNTAARILIDHNGTDMSSAWMAEFIGPPDDYHSRADQKQVSKDTPSRYPFTVNVSWRSGRKERSLDFGSFLFVRKTAQPS